MKNIHIQRIATKAIITNDKKQVLMLREAGTYEEGTNIGKYLLPGGRIEIGEHHLEGLKREVLEETGLEIAVKQPVLISEWSPVIKGIPTQIVAMFFACNAITTAVKLSSEHDDYKWLDLSELASFPMTESDRKAIDSWKQQ